MDDESDFQEQWRIAEGSKPTKGFVHYEPVMFAGIAVPQESRAFLLTAGLPRIAPPFLTFDPPKPRPLPTVAELYPPPDDALNRYWSLGSDGEGNPICLEDGTGQVVLLEHDNHFARVFVNRSVPAFAKSLLVHQRFCTQVMERYGSMAFLNGDYSAESVQRLKEQFAEIDAGAVEPGCFWEQEIQTLHSLREENG